MPVLWALACTLLWATISLASPPPAWNSQSTNYTSNINAILAARDLGINCQGSSSCKGHKTVAQGLVESINSFADDHVFGNEEYIGAILFHKLVYHRMLSVFPLTACLPGPSDDTNAGFCAFLQYVGSDVSAAKIKVLAGELIKHGCKGCGQVSPFICRRTLLQH